jgi:hypothetical protein
MSGPVLRLSDLTDSCRFWEDLDVWARDQSRGLEEMFPGEVDRDEEEEDTDE